MEGSSVCRDQGFGAVLHQASSAGRVIRGGRLLLKPFISTEMWRRRSRTIKELLMSLCSTEGGEAIPGKRQPAKQALCALKMVICIFRRNEAAFSLRASGYGSMGRSVVLRARRGTRPVPPWQSTGTAGPCKYSCAGTGTSFLPPSKPLKGCWTQTQTSQHGQTQL